MCNNKTETRTYYGNIAIYFSNTCPYVYLMMQQLRVKDPWPLVMIWFDATHVPWCLHHQNIYKSIQTVLKLSGGCGRALQR